MSDRKAVSFNVIGLDMSLSSTGFCKLSGGVFECCTIKTKLADHSNDILRRNYIVDAIFDRLPKKEGGSIDIDLLCVEDYFVPQSSKQMGAAIRLIELGAILRHRMYDNSIPFYVVVPTRLKKFVTGKGNCQKSMILREVYKRWAFDGEDDNQADAFGLAQLAKAILLTRLGADEDLTSFQKAVVGDVVKGSPRYNIIS